MTHHDVLMYEGQRVWRFLQILPEGCGYNGSSQHKVTPLHDYDDPMCFASSFVAEKSADDKETGS